MLSIPNSTNDKLLIPSVRINVQRDPFAVFPASFASTSVVMRFNLALSDSPFSKLDGTFSWSKFVLSRTIISDLSTLVEETEQAEAEEQTGEGKKKERKVGTERNVFFVWPMGEKQLFPHLKILNP
jgi:hypothetical protein